MTGGRKKAFPASLFSGGEMKATGLCVGLSRNLAIWLYELELQLQHSIYMMLTLEDTMFSRLHLISDTSGIFENFWISTNFK